MHNNIIMCDLIFSSSEFLKQTLKIKYKGLGHNPLRDENYRMFMFLAI